uniref:Naringenin-chalcone synthase n=1 Tax=Kofleria flava TaxID=694315 RepID=A0A3S5GXM7_9BACT|nr:naringenin-chalcone synthase [Kofleria flava]
MRDDGTDTVWLSSFSSRRPAYEGDQNALLDWIAEAHATSAAVREELTESARIALRDRIRRVIDRCACGPEHIQRRGYALAEIASTEWDHATVYDLLRHPHGRGTGIRSRVFAEITGDYFDSEYAGDTLPPRDLIHVTCTGYVSPSPAQRLVERKGWGEETRVSHAYQMGCYAAFPAVRLAAGALRTPPAMAAAGAPARVDVVHTELCSLHFDPGQSSVEQLVVQSLFADGFIRYAVTDAPQGPSLRVLALAEKIIPDSAAAMSWVNSDFGMQMTLARDVPEQIGRALRGFVIGLYQRAGLDLGADLRNTVAAVHPGGPRIIDGVRDILELGESQVQTSREVLRDFGNMSSATLPHIWMRLLADPNVPSGALVLSLAFGPGLTLCGGLFQKA